MQNLLTKIILKKQARPVANRVPIRDSSTPHSSNL
ncbi:Protein CBG25302 [Caenorhabditis briggsae]|uniref:Protein CBG25302 n=1 Tax=Caenorhabditis briggsae TaxID=6238 RepID=B6IIH2_CAEBR|nr:Protein CBG25302 [Caenorhabditis briggsae]CAR99702.1 Protein CBG25302 [Caenorhabditis briggsae]